MNDFTKEELENLVSWGEVYTEFGISWSDKNHRPLINKIKSMIDNYCDHEIIYDDGLPHNCPKCCYRCCG